jgi:molecular chaperone DnaJ
VRNPILEMPGPNLYDLLGVAKGATANEIRKAYLTLSRTHHPDKGGDPEEFKKIQKAYEILSDDDRRKMYDITGSEEEQGGGPGPFGPGGMPFGGMGMPFGMPFSFPIDLESIFGGAAAGRRGGPAQKRQGKPDPKIQGLPISLYDYYHGKDIELKFERQKFCESCKGEGHERVETCGRCGGTGTHQSVVMMGPGMQGVVRGPCPECGGRGKKSVGTCKGCNGSKTKAQEKVLHIRIEPGMRPGEVFMFSGECSDQAEYTEAGDVHIHLQGADEDIPFQRVAPNSFDLIVRVSISLKEALLGCRRVLDGHPGFPAGCEIEVPVGTQNGETVVVDGVGMIRRDGGKGALRIVVEVKATETEKEALRKSQEALLGIFTA